MASRILAQVLIAGGTMVARAAMQAYRQAIVNGQRAGVTPDSIKNAAKSKQMSLEEAKKILGIENNPTWDEVIKKYDRLFKINEKHGSFYLQSKIFRAKERLEEEQTPENQQSESQNPKP